MKNIRTQDTNKLQKVLDLEKSLTKWEGFYGESGQAHALNLIDAIETELKRREYW